MVGPWRDDTQPITVLLDSRLALEIMRLLGRQAEVKQSRRGKNMRARLKKKGSGAPTPEPESNQ